jgi:CBS domain-containing protein
MHVDQIMTRSVQTCRPEDTLERAAQLMWEHDCGCVPVCSGDGSTRVVGLITDRDICMCAFFQHRPLSDLRVSEAMSKQVKACKASDAPSIAEKIMSDGRIRRLPVVDERDALVGMISLADFAREASREIERPQAELTETEVGGTLAAICQPAAKTRAASEAH